VHRQDAFTEVLTQAVVRYAIDRMRLDPVPLDAPRTLAELRAMAGRTITREGLGGLEALRVFADVLAPACVSTDHPRYLAFVPAAPTESAILFDLVVGASCIYAGSWLEGSGAVFAENEALRWLADLAGLPQEAGGVFVSGGSAGNLSGLVAARHTWRRSDDRYERVRGVVVTGEGAHSSIVTAARVMDADVVRAGSDERGRLTGTSLEALLDSMPPEDAARAFAVVATAGTTNAGIIDDLDGVGRVCDERGLWLHVDGAYGGGAMVAPSARHKFRGIERADSLVVDPHKWLFAPFDCAAILYRDPALARAAHTQHAEYLDVLTESHEWNPSDFAYHLTRRARGLPFWFSLATHGTRRYEEAIEHTLAIAREAAALIDSCPHTELLEEPELSVVLFRRTDWTHDQYEAWSDRVLVEGLTLTVPSMWKGAPCLRFCFVNPRTTPEDVQLILDSLA